MLCSRPHCPFCFAPPVLRCSRRASATLHVFREEAFWHPPHLVAQQYLPSRMKQNQQAHPPWTLSPTTGCSWRRSSTIRSSCTSSRCRPSAALRRPRHRRRPQKNQGQGRSRSTSLSWRRRCSRIGRKQTCSFCRSSSIWRVVAALLDPAARAARLRRRFEVDPAPGRATDAPGAVAEAAGSTCSRDRSPKPR